MPDPVMLSDPIDDLLAMWSQRARERQEMAWELRTTAGGYAALVEAATLNRCIAEARQVLRETKSRG